MTLSKRPSPIEYRKQRQRLASVQERFETLYCSLHDAILEADQLIHSDAETVDELAEFDEIDLTEHLMEAARSVRAAERVVMCYERRLRSG